MVAVYILPSPLFGLRAVLNDKSLGMEEGTFSYGSVSWRDELIYIC